MRTALRSRAIHTLSPLFQVTHEEGKSPSIDKTRALYASHHSHNLTDIYSHNARTRLRVHRNKRGLETKALHKR